MSQSLPSIETLQATRMIVIGDLMIDRYLSGPISRISPEAPVPVLKLDGEESLLGGAANVVKNLVALGCRPLVAGVVGDDHYATQLREKIEQMGLSSDGILADPSRPTIIKTRVVSANQQILRLDRESNLPIDPTVIEQIKAFVLSHLNECAGVIFSDYDKGLLTPDLMEAIMGATRERDIPVFVDPKGLSFDKYWGASYITPNRKEAEQVAQIRDLSEEDDLRRLAHHWIETLELDGILITLGKAGLFVAQGHGDELKERSIEAEEREVFDVTGAGDTVIATFSLLVSAGMDVFEAAEWANRAAGVVVGKAGAATASREELMRYAERYEPWQRKVKSCEELKAPLEEAKRRGRRIVFTNGCFDLLHVGHIQLLQAARKRGDLLVVGLNSDDSVQQLKGEGRPVIPEKERLQILASLDCVDYLVVYSETTPNRLIEILQPDVLVKGANYSPEEVTGHEIVERYGGKVELMPIESEVSVSRLVDHILQHFGKDTD